MTAASENPSGAANNVKGILWMLAFAVLISSMQVTARLMSEGMHPFEVAFFRIVFGLVAVLPWFVRYGLAPLRTKRLGTLTIRGAINTVCMLAFFTALSITPLAEVTVLSFTAPIFATVLAVFAFGEVVGVRRWAAILCAFLGALVVLRPGFQTLYLGHILVLGSAFGWSICMILIKSVGKTESAVTITTYMSLVMAPLALIPALYFWTWPNPEQWAWLVFMGTLGGGAQMAMSQALRVADTHVVTPIDFSRLLIIALLAYLVFDQVPDIYVWIGGAMIFASFSYITYREHRLRKQGVAAAPIG